jgi:DNA invertase Pin-like site-specific DNA recombinase
MAAKPTPIRCAIYTRKSSEEGLDQAYNSLAAQRDACAAYVLSQAGEGWTLTSGGYDDGGFSGGTLDRPALQRLLADIGSGRIDVVVVYKVDRLTRSLTDFAKIVEVLDRHGASFVSVTQAFNTTTSMGRLTLNVLLSFAQFEREVTGERIRDKLAASKKLGMWMGGNVPLGYRPNERTLEIEPEEAETVRMIFRRYLALGSVHRLRHELAEAGVVSKPWVTRAGKVRGGRPLHRGALFHLLRNRTYLGEVPHKGQSYPGRHPPVIDGATFEAVQAKLDETAVVLRPDRPTRAPRPHSGAPLKGLIFDGSGARMSPVSARRKGGATYRYYVSRPLQAGAANRSSAGVRAPAGLVEDLVADQLRRLGLIDQTVATVDWTEPRRCLLRIEVTASVVTIRLKQEVGDRADIASRLLAEDRCSAADDGVAIVIPFRLARRAGGVVALNARGGDAIDWPRRDPALSAALVRAEAWKRKLLTGEVGTVDELARAEGVAATYAARLLRTAFLAPDLKRAILDGRQPSKLTLQAIMTTALPLDWRGQRDLFVS